MGPELVYLQEVWFTTSRYGKLAKGKITALGKNLLTINGKHVFHVDSKKLKGQYSSGKYYVQEQDYYDEKEYENNKKFIERAFFNLKDKLTLEQTRKIIEIMSDVEKGA